MSGKVNTFTPDGKGWIYPSHYASGKGTEAKPWVIVSPEQMSFIKDDLAAGEKRWFKLGADIDMTGIDWEPLNAASPYDMRSTLTATGTPSPTSPAPRLPIPAFSACCSASATT